MAKRSVRKRRRMESANSHTRKVTSAPAECEAEDCTAFPLAQVYLEELGRKVFVCPVHGKMLEIQARRNKNVQEGRAALDRQDVERQLGIQ